MKNKKFMGWIRDKGKGFWEEVMFGLVPFLFLYWFVVILGYSN